MNQQKIDMEFELGDIVTMNDDKIKMMGEPPGYKQNADSKRTLDADCLNDTIQEACRLALLFKRFCAENNLHATAEIAGCAWDVHATNEKSYIDGKKYEKDRIRSILGL